MAERIEALREEHLDECAHLYVSTFNAEPWNQRWTLETANKKLAWTLGVPVVVTDNLSSHKGPSG